MVMRVPINIKSAAEVAEMEPAERLAHCARVPKPLAQLVIEGAVQFGVDIGHFRGPSKKRAVAMARREIAVEARQQGYSFETIGRALNRDHSTIVYAVARAGQ